MTDMWMGWERWCHSDDMSSAVDEVTEHGGEFPALHLSGHLTPDAGWTAGRAQTVVAQTALKNTREEFSHLPLQYKHQ